MLRVVGRVKEGRGRGRKPIGYSEEGMRGWNAKREEGLVIITFI